MGSQDKQREQSVPTSAGGRLLAAGRRLADITYEIATKVRAFNAAKKSHAADIEALEDERQKISDDIRSGQGGLFD